MWEEILSTAQEQAERSSPAVRAAALLHIARVLVVSDPGAGLQLLERGIGLAEELAGEDRKMILGEATFIAASVSPKVAISLYAAREKEDFDPFEDSLIRLMNVMATHGHAAEAVEYLCNPLPGSRFPLHFVNNIAHECKDDDTRRDLLRAAIRAWREPARVNFGPGGLGRGAFAGFFARSWELLSREEALTVLGEIVQWIGQVRDTRPLRRTITGKPGDAEFTTEKQHLYFLILPVLRRLDPARIEALCEGYPEFAVAARRYPRGYESVRREQTGSGVCEDCIVVADHVVPISEALANDFAEAFAEAFEWYKYYTDAENPIEAPKECWRSTDKFRNILFKAGKHLGAAALKHLERIPDADIRLLAQIELCAGMAGAQQGS
jgi:hypothetical protein